MARRKDGEHCIVDQAQLAVLMDLRDELKKLNSLLHCHNFMAIPRKLDRISANTYRAKRRRKPRAAS